MSMQIRAVSTTPLDIRAALQHPEVKSVARILAAAGVPVPTVRFKHSELHACLCAADVSPEDRMKCKIALDKAGLIDWSC
jgi:hypothetical protein